MNCATRFAADSLNQLGRRCRKPTFEGPASSHDIHILPAGSAGVSLCDHSERQSAYLQQEGAGIVKQTDN